jgi:hypothetical protein
MWYFSGVLFVRKTDTGQQSAVMVEVQTHTTSMNIELHEGDR